MKILVTGAAGYVGSSLVGELLSTGHEVLAFDDLSGGSASLLPYAHDPDFEFTRGDVRDETAIRGYVLRADAIIPLAAVVGMPACDREPERARAVNVDAIRLLMRLRSTAQRIVFPNTNSGYGTTTSGRLCTEETTLAPISLYARLKAEAETIVMEQENTVALRLATVFGVSPRMRRDLLVNNFVWRAMKDRRLEVYEGGAMRNYVHVLDVATAFRKLATDCPPAGVYNFGNDKINLSKWALAMTIAGHFAIGAVKVTRADGADPDQRNYIVSSDKLARAGVRATLGLDAGIKELIRGYWCDPELYEARV